MKTVYLSMSTDVIHNGHIRIINEAAKLGELTVGVLSDEAVSRYKRFPLLSYAQRAEIMQSIKGVARVVEQKTLDYTQSLLTLKPDIVVHGDDWRVGIQAPVRARVLEVLASYGGELIEFPYYNDEGTAALEADVRRVLGMPENRRGQLKSLLCMKPLLRIMEAHNGLTGLIVEETKVEKDGKIMQFDGMWISSLCDSTIKGKPDIELVDNTSRFHTIDEIMEVTTKPIILDGDTGGKTEHFGYLVKSLERMGVSAVIIEDKIGLKKNSLFGADAGQAQASIPEFCQKITTGKRALTTRDFMIIARIESLILNRGMEDALKRAFAYTEAGADGIMIHSCQHEPHEVFTFCREFRKTDPATALVVVPTTFNSVTEDEWANMGVNIVIYANQLIRSAFPAMERTAKSILSHGRCMEADEACMPIQQILTLIPGAQ
ncbi:MAG: phosphoenolpyruvate mutase [Christensenellales bacterium]